LIMSSPEELRPFLRSVRHRRASLGGIKAWHFQGKGFEGLAFLVGMGGAAPRLLAERAIAAFSPDLLIVAGFGGALTALPPPGGVLLAAECWRLEPAGHLPRREDFQPVAPPQALVAHLQAQGLAAYVGTLVTTPKLTPKASLPTQLSHLTLPVLDLETSQVAATATAHHLPFLAVRAITDGAGEEIHDFLADIINQHQGVPLSRLLPALWADPRRLGYCLHLWRRSRLAGKNLARALNLILDYLSMQEANNSQ
jgi:adenosylhomocysteine nucleosidase